jgi:hypothetical protein
MGRYLVGEIRNEISNKKEESESKIMGGKNKTTEEEGKHS